MKLIEVKNYLKDNKEKHLEKAYSFENGDIMSVQLKKGEGIAEHKSSENVIIVVKSGHVQFDVEGEKVNLTDESLLHIAPDEMHSLTAIEDTIILVCKFKKTV